MTAVRHVVQRLAAEAALRWSRKLRTWKTGPVTCHVRKLEIVIDVSTPLEHWRVETYTEKEPETLDWLDGQLRQDDVLWDVGASIGLYTLYAAKRMPSCSVYAFEPAGPNLAKLCRNVLLNGAKRVLPCGIAVGGRTGVELFNLYDIEAGAALHSWGEASPYRQGRAVLRQVMWGATLDDLVTVYGLPQPTLLKLDVDGLEAQILAGGRAAVLRSERLRSILVELSGMPIEELRALEKEGFELVAKGPSIETGGMVSQNHVFVRRRA